jgi:hypothetical protein
MTNPIIFGLLPLIASHGIMITQQGDGFCFFPITPLPTAVPTSQPIINKNEATPSFEKEKNESFKNTTLRLGNTSGGGE